MASVGTGLYAVKAAPTKNDDTQSGAATDHGDDTFTITLTTGGLGAAAAFAGGYVENVTEAETAAIISHTATTVTMAAHAGITVANWTNGDDLDVYDAWSTIQDAHDQLVIDQGVAAFVAEQEIRVYAGTFTEYVTIDHTLEPQPRYRLVFKAAAGDSPVWSCQGLAGVMTSAGALSFVDFDGLTFAGTATGAGPIALYFNSISFEFRNCTFTLKPTGSYVFQYAYQHVMFLDCELNGDDKSFDFFQLAGSNNAQFVRCDMHDYDAVAYLGGNGTGVHMEACTVHDVNDAVYALGAGHVALLNNTFYNVGRVLFDRTGRARLVMLDNVFDTVAAVVKEEAAADDAFTSSHVVIDGNCYHDVTKWYDSVGESDVVTFAGWQALGYDTNGLDADPLLVDPASDDFTLEAGSPCRRAGVGSGAKIDVVGIAYDRHYPDVGAHSMTQTITTPVWPASLPQTVDQPQFTEALANVVERSEMDSGPAKIRRRFTGGIQTFAATMTLTVAQAAALQTFHDDTVDGGALSFQWDHPRTGAAAEMRFVTPPTLTQRGPAHFVAALRLEILP